MVPLDMKAEMELGGLEKVEKQYLKFLVLRRKTREYCSLLMETLMN